MHVIRPGVDCVVFIRIYIKSSRSIILLFKKRFLNTRQILFCDYKNTSKYDDFFKTKIYSITIEFKIFKQEQEQQQEQQQ